jgi:DNA-binding NarL/FixJ family response regulator
MLKIVLADDHRMFRQGIKALLGDEKDFQVVAEADDGLQAVRLCEQHQPDVLVLDLIMPGLRGMDVARQVSERLKRTRVVVLSMHADEAWVMEALRNGASAYVLKDAHAAELIKAVREVAAGRRYLSPPLSERAIDAYIERARRGESTDVYDDLTNREREVLKLVAEGHTNAAIAQKLFLSPRTVEAHRASLMHKLGLRSQADLVLFAVNRGVVAPEPRRQPKTG